MKIKEITWQDRRDFRAILECEHCGNEQIDASAYDDAYYHEKVIPSMECKKCGKRAPDTYRPMTTKYPPDQVV